MSPEVAHRRLGREWGVALAVVVLTAVVSTWPLATSPWLVPQHQDPLFSSWRLYQWARNFAAAGSGGWFGGNVFHPSGDVLLMSDAIPLQAALAAPFIWMGVPVVVVYSALFWLSTLTAGLAMYACARTIASSHRGALVAAVMFTGAPLRLEHVMHLELLSTAFLPLSVLATARAFAGGRRAPMALAAALAGQFLACIYYGVFMLTVWPLVAAAEWWRRRHTVSSKTFVRLAGGVAIAAVVAAVYAVPYQRARRVVGDRADTEIGQYGASWSAYVVSPPSNRWWGWTAGVDDYERRLFPGLFGSAVAVGALATPAAPWTAAVALGAVVAADGSRGMNGVTYPWLRALAPPYRGLRVPARFGMIALTMLALLAAMGTVALERSLGNERQKNAVAAGLLIVMVAESASALPVRRLPAAAPPVYALLATMPPTVIAHLPLPRADALPGAEADFQYFAQYHRHRLVNGNSGFYPPSYLTLLEAAVNFPDEASLTALRAKGVEYLLVHQQHYPTPQAFARVVEALERRRDTEPVATSTDDGGVVRVYRLGAP